jgi:hypothetical protein
LAGGGGVTDDDNSVTKRYLKNRIFNSWISWFYTFKDNTEGM